ncbi:homospermidine synthase [Falsiroseomonas sp.]|uniref:homospermidine synthase n=1 Tax=Falsiroseomonas sp. TaxID=2870721 RepID=UPI00271F6517|nr:saccharopine dehydrogenase C-terminal domain-containing protein [Falsiroseomonas sp.]MDO9498913.1 saccharopine dehydrogenase NADP-binding domain-containing protein [Falsiroseomonas sp.]
MKHAEFSGGLVMLGFGSIGQGVLPLILRHIDIPAERITIVTAETRGEDVAAEYGIRFILQAATRENFADLLSPLLAPGDFLLNLSVDVSSVELMKLCHKLDVLYLDTVVEPWAGGYTDTSLTPSQRSNYAMREAAIALRPAFVGGPTSITAHGANPGLVSHFVKQALLNIARDTGAPIATPPPASDRTAWAQIASDLGVKVIHIAERDTQVAERPKKPGEFVNTWSVDGFVGEGCQPAELGWGSHEKALPPDGHRHGFGCDAAIYLMRPGASTRVRTWTPLEGPMHGFLITHNESISLADYYTLRDDTGAVTYRPTAHYAYHPCDDAVLSVHELAGKNWEMQPEKRLMTDEITHGMDELGVLLMGHAKGAYWFGSRLTIGEARRAAPHNNATSLQVTAAVLAGVIWAMENPRQGLVESDEIDHARVLEICAPYLGDVVGEYAGWTPLEARGVLFPEDVDTTDPWQFRNFRVT